MGVYWLLCGVYIVLVSGGHVKLLVVVREGRGDGSCVDAERRGVLVSCVDVVRQVVNVGSVWGFL